MNAELKALAERIARLEDDKAEIASDIRDLKAEASGEGYDAALLAKVVRIMRMDADKRKKALDQIELFDTYLAGVGLLAETPEQIGRRHLAAAGMVSTEFSAAPTRACSPAGAARTLTNPRHVVKPSEVQKIADRAAARSADPPQPEEKADAAAALKPPDRTDEHRGGAALVAASSSDEDLDIPPYLDRRSREDEKCLFT